MPVALAGRKPGRCYFNKKPEGLPGGDAKSFVSTNYRWKNFHLKTGPAGLRPKDPASTRQKIPVAAFGQVIREMLCREPSRPVPRGRPGVARRRTAGTWSCARRAWGRRIPPEPARNFVTIRPAIPESLCRTRQFPGPEFHEESHLPKPFPIRAHL